MAVKETEARPRAEGDGGPRSAEGALSRPKPIETLGLVVGVLGATAMLFGAVLYAIDPGVLPLATGNLVFGAAGAVVYAATNRRQLGRALGGRSAPLVGLEVLTGLGVLGAVFAVNWVGHQSAVEWDLTRDGLYTLNPQSVAVAERLDAPIVIHAFYPPSESTAKILEQAVQLYRRHTDRLELRLIDPDRAPTELAERFSLTSKSARIVFEHLPSGRFTKIKRPTEEAMTNALIQLAEDRQRRVFFTRGHGEPSLGDQGSQEGFGQARVLLGNEGLKSESYTSVDREEVPEEAAAVLVVRPRSPLLPNEVRALIRFLDRGGRVGLLLEPRSPHGLDALLERFGVVVGDDLVVDQNPASRALGFGPDAPVIQSYESHPITEVMAGRFTLFYRARSVSPRLGAEGVRPVTLIRTRESAFAETSTTGGPPELDGRDLAGPVPLAVAVTKPTADHPRSIAPEGRLVVFGDADFASNRFTAMVGNVDLFTNTVNWLVGDEDRITIRPPQRTGDRLPLTAAQRYGIVFFSVNLLPLLIVGVGFSVWAVRRRR